MSYHSFCYLSPFSDPIRFGNMEPKRITVIASFNRVVNTKNSLLNPNVAKYINPTFDTKFSDSFKLLYRKENFFLLVS